MVLSLTACGKSENPPANQSETSSSSTVSTPNNSKPDTASTPAAASAPAESSTPDTTSAPEAPKEIDWSTVPYTYAFSAHLKVSGATLMGYSGNEKVLNIPPLFCGVKVIAISLTEGNFGFTDLNIPDSVTAIEDDDFKLCTNLTSVNIPDSVTKIGTSAFSNCPNIKVKYNGKEYDYDHLDSLYSDINGN